MSTPQGSDPLAGVRLKIERAKEHINELGREVRSFLDSNPYLVVSEFDTETGDELFRVHITEQIPLTWGVMLGDIFHNLRTGLDHLAEQLIIKGGSTPNKYTGFPISDTAQEFVAGGLGKVSGASPRAIRILSALKPYRGGCEPLWWLHKLNNIDKHHLIVPVGSSHRSVTVHTRTEVPWADEPITAPGIVLRPADRLFPLVDGEIVFVIKAEARQEPELQHNYEFTFEVAFGESGVVEGEPLMPTLIQLADFIERIVDIFGRYVFG